MPERRYSQVGGAGRLDSLDEDAELLVLLTGQARHAKAQTSAIFLAQLKTEVHNLSIDGRCIAVGAQAQNE